MFFILQQLNYDGRIRRELLQITRYPTARFRVYDIEGAGGELPAIGSYKQALLRGELELLGQTNWLDIPVRIFRFAPSVFGMEPVEPLLFDTVDLGVDRAVADLNESTGSDYPKAVKVIFRLEMVRQ